MQEQYQLICLLVLFLTECETDDWHGDPTICKPHLPNSPSPIPSAPVPQFTNQAEFTLEQMIIRHRSNSTSKELTLTHFIYDYDRNQLSLIEDKSGSFDSQFYDYRKLSKSTYNYRDNTCVREEIDTDIALDGRSAIRNENGTWHIRPMNEFLLFSSTASGREVTPIYLGSGEVRGIPVDTWETCFIDPLRLMTERRLWSFAQQNISMPSGNVGEIGVPIQAVVNGSTVYPNGTQRARLDQIFNVLSYRSTLIESDNPLIPLKGVHCDQILPQELVSLEDVGIRWPYRFNVRVEVSTSRSPQWQRFHLYYHQGDSDATSRLRYDYLPSGSEDFRSIIHDYTDNLTYTIDRRLGTCQINRGVEIPDVDPLVDPIQFLIKNDAIFISNSPEKIWDNKGLLPCRTNSIQCAILTTSKDDFPNIIEPTTGKPTGETWAKTNIEYAWSMRSPNTRSSSNTTKYFDYPVSLYLKMYDYENPFLPSTHVEDIEYEFYEMSHDDNLNRFDISTCYRSAEYEYLHLMFILKLNRGNLLDGNHFNRRRLDNDVHYHLANRMQIRYSRITDLEIDHEGTSNDVTVFFTLLGQTPNPDSESGVMDDEPTAVQAHDRIKQIIDDGKFLFQMELDDHSEVEFQAESDSLKASKQYMSTHSVGQKVIKESYTLTSQVLPVVIGLLVGLLLGILLAAVLRIIRKDPMPSFPLSISNPLPPIHFRPGKTNETTSDA